MDLVKRSIGTPDQDLLYKVIKGDDSDNIPAIAPKIGPVTAKKVVFMDPEEREEWIKRKGQTAVENFENNRRLVSFNYIPESLRESFRSSCSLRACA